MFNQKGYSLPVIILIVLLIAVSLGWYFKQNGWSLHQLNNRNQITQQTTSLSYDKTNWKSYINSTYEYSFSYPGSWVRKESGSVESGIFRPNPLSSPRFESPDFNPKLGDGPLELKGNYVVVSIVSYYQPIKTIDDIYNTYETSKPPLLPDSSKGGALRASEGSLQSIEKSKLGTEDAIKMKTIYSDALLKYELVKNGKVYSIACAYNPNITSSLSLCEQITSTFKFTDSNP